MSNGSGNLRYIELRGRLDVLVDTLDDYQERWDALTAGERSAAFRTLARAVALLARIAAGRFPVPVMEAPVVPVEPVEPVEPEAPVPEGEEIP